MLIKSISVVSTFLGVGMFEVGIVPFFQLLNNSFTNFLVVEGLMF